MLATMRAISVSESSGKARLMLRRACPETPRKGPMRRASTPPRAEAQSKGKNLNPPNRDAAPQASRRWATRGVLAEGLGAGVLALGVNCANQVGIRFRRRRLSRSLCPPLRVASVRSPTRLRSRNCHKDSRCPQFRAAAVRQIAAFAPHRYPRERAKAARQWSAYRSLHSGELIFSDDALVTVGLAFNAVLEHVPCLGEQANDFEEPALYSVFLIPIRRKSNCLANHKFMGGHSISQHDGRRRPGRSASARRPTALEAQPRMSCPAGRAPPRS